MENYDGIKIGLFLTEDYLEFYRKTHSESFEKIYKLKHRPDMISTDDGVRNYGIEDTSDVFEVVAKSSATDVLVQNATNEPINYYLCQCLGTTNPSSDYVTGSTDITLDSVTGAVVNQCLNIRGTRFYQGIIKAINGNVVTVDPEIDFDITTADTVCFGNYNMIVDGSTTPVTFRIQPPAGVEWDIQTFTFSITDQTDMDDEKFGGLVALPNGILLRHVDGYVKNDFLIYNNVGFIHRGFETDYADKAPSGFYGYRGIKNIVEKNGIAVRLNGDTGDSLELIVRDDLTDLDSFIMLVMGHVVTI